jgi:hypothetical protein
MIRGKKPLSCLSGSKSTARALTGSLFTALNFGYQGYCAVIHREGNHESRHVYTCEHNAQLQVMSLSNTSVGCTVSNNFLMCVHVDPKYSRPTCAR